MIFGRRPKASSRFDDRKTVRRRRRRRRLLQFVFLAAVAAVVWPTVFIATQCSDSGVPEHAYTPPADLRAHARDESLTFLTYPEWSIVFSADEYARFLELNPPSAYPHFASIRQYWAAYDSVCEVTTSGYAFNRDYHIMLGVIGVSFSAEHLIKGVYEKTIGRLTEWLGSRDTPEDKFAAYTALEYGAFMHQIPWFEYRFADRLGALWRETPMWGPHKIRKWERRFMLSAEYGVKAVYGWVIKTATKSAYAPEDSRIYALIDNVTEDLFTENSGIHKVKEMDSASTKPSAPLDPTAVEAAAPRGRAYIVTLPRYEAFTHAVVELQQRGVRFVSIAGNDDILLTAIAPESLGYEIPSGLVIMSQPILTDRTRKRIAVRVPVTSLVDLMSWLAERKVTVEHVYDY